jgi:uncharacterized protein with HEPN domain
MTLSKSSNVQPSVADRIDHIATALDRIRQITAGQTRESFKEDFLVGIGVERLLGIISEASRHIPPDMKAQAPDINWRRMADLGNWLRHAYHRIDADLLWAMIEDDLEPLRIFVERTAKESKR